MAPRKGANKVAKKAVSKTTKSQKGGGDKRLIKVKNTKETYSGYISKVMKEVHPSNGVSKKAMSTMNSLVNDITESIAADATTLANCNRRSKNITSREIQQAVRLHLPDTPEDTEPRPRTTMNSSSAGRLHRVGTSQGTTAVPEITMNASCSGGGLNQPATSEGTTAVPESEIPMDTGSAGCLNLPVTSEGTCAVPGIPIGAK